MAEQCQKLPENNFEWIKDTCQFHEDFIKKTLIKSKILMYQFWYDYVKPKYGEKSKLCYMDTDSLYT